MLSYTLCALYVSSLICEETATMPEKYRMSQMAELLSHGSMTQFQALDRMRYLVKANLLNDFSDRDGPASLFWESQLCVAATLFALIDGGVAGQEVLNAASTGLNAGEIPLEGTDPQHAEINARKETPVDRAIADVRAGGTPSFMLTTFRHSENGSLRHAAVVLPTGQKPSPPPQPVYAPLLSIIVDLASIWTPLLRDRTKGN
jgi:hypothetical protein